MKRTSSRQDRFSVILTPHRTIAIALACGLAGAPTLAEPFFGFEHTAEGNATLGLTPDDRLVVSNIGSSGLDGVRIDLGDVRGHSIDLDIGELGSLAAGSCTYVYHPYDWRNGCIYTKETSSGSAAVGIDGTGAQPTCVRVTLFDDGVAVDSRAFTGTLPASLVTGDMGTDPVSGEPLSLNFTQIAFSYCYTMTLPTDSLLTIEGSALGAVTADQCVISLDGLPPGEPVTGEITVLAANMPGGQLTIGSESVLLPATHVSGTIGVLDGNGYASVSLNGDATGSGRTNGDLCTFCPECCDVNFEDLLQELGGLTVSNIGSSGLDGVSFAVAEGENFPEVTIDVNALDPDDDGDTIELSATGVLAGTPGSSPLGTCTITNVAGTYQLDADYSALGSNIVRVEVLDRGTSSGFADIQNIPGIPLGQLLPAAGSTYTVNKCGKLPGGGVSPPCFVACSPEPFTFLGGGQVLVGDELRVLAISATSSIDEIETLTVNGRGLPDFTCAPAYDPKAPAPWSGMLASPVDGAELSITPTGKLKVSNLGSSGCDGVSIDIGGSDGTSLEIADGAQFAPDVFFDIEYGLFDQYCATCPAVASMGVQITATDTNAGSMQFDADPVVNAVIEGALIDASGDVITTFQGTEADVFGISGDAGARIRVKAVNAIGRSQWILRGEPVKGINISIGQETGEGVTVTDNTGTPHPGVHLISVTTTQPPVPTVSAYRGHVTVLKSPGPGGGGEMELGALALMLAGSHVHAVDGARVDSEDCDDGSSTAGRLRVSNLGSSGCDGVSIDLGEGWGNGVDADNDGIAELPATGIQIAMSGFDPDPDNNCAIVMSAQSDDDTGAVNTHTLTLADNGAGGRVLSADVCCHGVSMTMRALDDSGTVLAEETGLPLAATATVQSLTLPSGARFGVETEVIPCALGCADWEEPVSVVMPSGTAVQNVSRFEVVFGRTGGPNGDSVALTRFDVLLQAHLNERVSFDITDITVTPESPCFADCDGNGTLNIDDIDCFIAAFIGGDLPGSDCDGNGTLNIDDIDCFVASFLSGCP